MIYIKLFLTFFEIGMFTFGGGYAMISLIRDKALAFGWLSEEEILNMVAVSESTPGPIAVNMATFVGSTQGGVFGALAATLGVVLPSFIVILLIAAFIRNFLKYKGVQAFLGGVRPCIVALILATAITMSLSTLLDFTTLTGAMEIAGYAIGANQGYVYVRAEYPIAVNRLQKAIDDARAEGLLGKNIFGTEFEFDLQIRLGAGAFVCGEETALLTSIEGNRGEPRPRPPFPAVKGLWGKPTIINNVETYANIPQIINKGAKWFTSMGTEKSKGTKVFALGGKIVNTGLVEIPMGTTLREVVEEIGGGIPNGKKFKAAQTGGPSGGCIPASKYDVAIDYDNLIAEGSMMGSGGLIVMDEETCMVDLAKFFLEFTVDESCGKCAPCRIGTVRLLEILNKITEGNGELEDLDKLEELANYIKSASLCGLGQTAPNPVLSTLANFRDEYVAHIVDKKCPAGVCKKLFTYKIDLDKCMGCGLCAKQCPADAISRTDYVAAGHKLASMQIDASKCVKCGACLPSCKKFGAIYKG